MTCVHVRYMPVYKHRFTCTTLCPGAPDGHRRRGVPDERGTFAVVEEPLGHAVYYSSEPYAALTGVCASMWVSV